MAVSPYEVLAPYRSLDRTQRLDRWTQLHADPPRQQAHSLEPAAPPEPAESADSTEVPEPVQTVPPRVFAPPVMPERNHHLYDQIIRKHTHAAQSVLTSAMRHP